MRELLLLAAFMLPGAMTLLDASMLAVALPTIQAQFGVQVDVLALVIAAGFLPRVALMPVFGRIGDMLGKKSVYLAGLALYAAGSGLAIFASSFEWLVLARVVQGIGAAGNPLAVALIVDAFPRERSGRALGLYTASGPFGNTIGPVVGGLVVENLGWHAIFVIILITSISTFPVVARLVPEGREQRELFRDFDWFGAISLVATALFFLLALTTLSIAPFGSLPNLVFWLCGLAGSVALLRSERRHSSPFLDLAALRNPSFILPSIAVNFRMVAQSGTTFLLVLYLTNVYHNRPSQVGLLMGFYTVALMLGMAFGGVIADRWSTRLGGTLGMLLLALGMLSIALVGDRWGLYGPVLGMLVAGVGSGACLAPFTKRAVHALGDAQVGFASGLFSMLRFTGSALATPMVGLVLASGFARYGGDQSAVQPHQNAFLLLAGAALIGGMVALRIPTRDVKATPIGGGT